MPYPQEVPLLRETRTLPHKGRTYYAVGQVRTSERAVLMTAEATHHAVATLIRDPALRAHMEALYRELALLDGRWAGELRARGFEPVELARGLRRGVEAGHFRLLEEARATTRGGTGEATGAADAVAPLASPAAPAAQPVTPARAASGAASEAPPPAQAAPVKTFIEIALVDSAGKPVPDEPFSVEVPGGLTISGSLNSAGKSKLEGIDPGTCKIRFPNLDAKEWQETSLVDSGKGK